jgi:formylglycine-generating enzyme required for sulfatase activity
MRGNVYEWCHDGYDEYDGPETDPSGSAASSYKVARGGSFAASGGSLRAAARHKADPGSRMYIYGFRVARSVD